MQFLIIDDHPVIRKGLIYVITCEPEGDKKKNEVGNKNQKGQ